MFTFLECVLYIKTVSVGIAFAKFIQPLSLKTTMSIKLSDEVELQIAYVTKTFPFPEL